MKILIAILIALALVVLFALGRMFYRRSVRIRNRLQMDRMFTNISHELLTPLTVISASIERLRLQEPRFSTDYALMDLNVQRMVRLLQEILETSKSQSGELKLLVSQGDVMRYITQTALCLEPLMKKKQLDFVIDCVPQSMMGWIDTDKLDKIIYNLLSNAAKYTQTGGKVRLEVHTNKTYDHVIIKVYDNGIGITPEKMQHLFQRFNDGDYRRMNAIGTGLGLALTRELVYLNGGSIDCQSQPNQGTTFTVELPINKEAFNPSQIDEAHPIDLDVSRTNISDLVELMPQPKNPRPLSLPLAGEDAYQVLLVEDNEELLMLMRTMLSGRYRIVTAKNGREALEVVKKEELDLIVSDVMMPEMDGNELTRRVKENPEWSHLPIILLTARTQDEDRQNSMRIGADDYIIKPFRLGELQLRIDNIIENRKRILGERTSQVETEQETPSEPLPPSPEEEFMQKAKACVMEHLSDADFDRDAFAAAMGASTSTLYNRLRAITGMNVSAYIRNLRMAEAARIAQRRPDMRVSDLAYQVGFDNPRYFATCFKKEYGLQPSEYMNSFLEKHQQEQDGNTVD